MLEGHFPGLSQSPHLYLWPSHPCKPRCLWRHAQEQDPVIAQVLFFFEKHWEELLKFSRRTQRHLERWAGRYNCVNLQNRDTVEFRMFRGTLKSNTILATLQLLDRICDVALFLSDEQLRALAWTSFVSGISPARFPQLVQYLKERQLYINDPVEREEDL